MSAALDGPRDHFPTFLTCRKRSVSLVVAEITLANGRGGGEAFRICIAARLVGLRDLGSFLLRLRLLFHYSRLRGQGTQPTSTLVVSDLFNHGRGRRAPPQPLRG